MYVAELINQCWFVLKKFTQRWARLRFQNRFLDESLLVFDTIEYFIQNN